MATQWKHGDTKRGSASRSSRTTSAGRTATQTQDSESNALNRTSPTFLSPPPEFTTIPKSHPTMPLVKRIKALFSRKLSPRNSSRTTSASDTSSMEAPSDGQRRLSSSSVSSAYAEIVAPFNDLDWMMNVSPTATLTESDTAPHSPSLPQASQQAKKKRRPVSMFASLSSPLRQSSADYRAQWENRRRSVTLPFPVLAVPGFSPAATRLSGTFEFAFKNMLTIFSRCLHLPRGALRIPPTVLLPVHHQSRAIRLPLSSIIPPEMGWTVEKTSAPPASHNDKADPLYDPNPEDRYTINTFTQGIVLDPESRNKSDPQYMSAQEGRSVRVHGSGSPLCAASAENGVAQMKPMDLGKGNKEGVGFVEQVGSASATARMFEREQSVKMLESKLGRDLARETFENARASALARKLVG
ncbi:hypothetical protein NMY22_g9325 [Coprinellus aureogranulatus]|nr:hypothetical protein NMY22_g9325 [Coprinellus aureogranulatus]